MPRKKKAQGTTASAVTIIEFLLDETGSMASVREATIGGFNEYINEQRMQPSRCLLTLTKFDTCGQRTPYVDMDIHMVPHLDHDTYSPNASTNLYDTIGRRIVALEQRIGSHNWTTPPNVLFVIMTDGMDNASRIDNALSIKEKITGKEGANWTFVYLGANQDAWAVGQQFGMTKANTMTYDTKNMATTMSRLSEATTTYRAFAATGQCMDSTYQFFADSDEPPRSETVATAKLKRAARKGKQ